MFTSGGTLSNSLVKKVTLQNLLASVFMMSVFAPTLGATDIINEPAVVSIIIDDIGYRFVEDKQMIDLPGELTYAILPNGPKARQSARYANQRGKEVILHMPMQSTFGVLVEKGVIDVDMDEKGVIKAIREAFEKVPHAIGMNNHQGSLLTRHPGHMTWVMKEMARLGYFFVDSRTSSQSIAEMIAREQGVPVLRRDVFLDHDIDINSIRRQFNELVALAKQKGSAIGIGHPHPETIAVLKELLPSLALQNIKLAPVSYQLQQKNLSLLAH